MSAPLHVLLGVPVGRGESQEMSSKQTGRFVSHLHLCHCNARLVPPHHSLPKVRNEVVKPCFAILKSDVVPFSRDQLDITHVFLSNQVPEQFQIPLASFSHTAIADRVQVYDTRQLNTGVEIPGNLEEDIGVIQVVIVEAWSVDKMYFIVINVCSCELNFFRTCIGVRMNPKWIGIYLQDFKPCSISISSSPAMCLIKYVFPTPVIPMTVIRMDLLVKLGKGIPNFLVQSKRPCWRKEEIDYVEPWLKKIHLKVKFGKEGLLLFWSLVKPPLIPDV